MAKGIKTGILIKGSFSLKEMINYSPCQNIFFKIILNCIAKGLMFMKEQIRHWIESGSEKVVATISHITYMCQYVLESTMNNFL